MEISYCTVSYVVLMLAACGSKEETATEGTNKMKLQNNYRNDEATEEKVLFIQ